MLQCVLYIFLEGALFVSSGCLPYQGSVTIDRVEYVDSYPASPSYRHSERIPMGYTLHRSNAPMRYHADHYNWYLHRGLWYKRPIGLSGYRYRNRGIYPRHRPPNRIHRHVPPKKVFRKPKKRYKPKKRHKPKKKHKKQYKRTCHVW